MMVLTIFIIFIATNIKHLYQSHIGEDRKIKNDGSATFL